MTGRPLSGKHGDNTQTPLHPHHRGAATEIDREFPRRTLEKAALSVMATDKNPRGPILMKMLKLRRGRAQPARLRVAAGDRARDAQAWVEAARHYKAALEIKPEWAAIWVQYGHMIKEAGRMEEAEAAYRRAVELEPDEADTHLQIGYLMRRMRRPEAAADAFLRAVELDPSVASAVAELKTLAGRGIEIDQERLARVLPQLRRPVQTPSRADSLGALTARLDSLLSRSRAAGRPEAKALVKALTAGVKAAEALEALEAETARGLTHVVFDVSDLISYFDNARLPTGIQRVQIEVITALLTEPAAGLEVRVCAFTSGRDAWVEVPQDVFLSMADLSLVSGERNDPVWMAALDDLKTLLAMSPILAFPRGAWLINLGTSWWLQNYFLHVRRAKAAYGVRYVPFVHDLIPIMAPEHCVQRLTQDFISWASGVFAHADRYLTNSEASKRDFLKVAAILGAEVPADDVHVVRLDADFRKPAAPAPMAESLARYGLTENDFVLFVSTIESRKNHLAAFAAWTALAQKHGVDAMPTLVCVGNRGWLNDAVFTRAGADPVLRQKVRMISGVSDPDLANLYRASRFTLYPSMYEGWGLPVTESLCYGKAALLSDSSSLPEAGGDHAVFFPLGDQKAFEHELERLMFDDAWRAQAEARAAAFRPRPWRALGLEIAETVRDWAAQDAEAGLQEAAPLAPTMAEPGRYYWMRRVTETRIAPGMTATEIFRIGDGWWQPDDWGVWTKGQGGTLAIGLPANLGPARLYLGLQGIHDKALTCTVSIAGKPVESGVIRRKKTQWVSLPLAPDQIVDGVLRIDIKGDKVEDFSIATKGGDPRVAGVGLIGFMVCAEDDATARADMADAIAFKTLPELADRYLAQNAAD